MPRHSSTKTGQKTSGNSTVSSQWQPHQNTSPENIRSAPHRAVRQLIRTLIDPDDDPFELGRSFIDDSERRRIFRLPWAHYLDNPKVVLFLSGLILRESRVRRPGRSREAYFQDDEIGIPKQAVQYLQQLSRVMASLGHTRRSTLAKFSTNLLGSLALKHDTGPEFTLFFPRAPSIEKSLLDLGYAYATPQNYILGDAFSKTFLYTKPALIALVAGSPTQIRSLTNALRLSRPYLSDSKLPIADILTKALLKYLPLPNDALFRITLLASANILCDACGKRKVQFYRNAKIAYEDQSIRLSIFLCGDCVKRKRRPDCARTLTRVGFSLVKHASEARILDVGPTKKAIRDDPD